MTIISASERERYLNDLADLSWPEIEGYLLRAEAIAQGPQGSNRQLSITTYHETPYINSDGILRLRYYPIVLSALTPVVEIRGHAANTSFRRYSPGTEWTTIDPDSYTFDEDLNELRLTEIPFFSTVSATPATFYGYSRQRSRRYPPMSPQETLQLRIKYAAGYDFEANPLSTAADTIKRALGAMASIYASPQARGASSMKIDDIYEFNVSFSGGVAGAIATSKMATSLLDDMLILFRQFAPRETLR